jgi:hypothetical protein
MRNSAMGLVNVAGLGHGRSDPVAADMNHPKVHSGSRSKLRHAKEGTKRRLDKAWSVYEPSWLAFGHEVD